MADVKSMNGNDLRYLLNRRPELLERLIGITIDRDTFKNEYWIDVHPGRQKIDFCFQDTEGKHYVVKVALGERLLNAVRHPNIWQKRLAEVNKIDIESVVPILMIDEEAISSNPRSKRELAGFPHINVIQYKVDDMAKELET